MKKKLYLSVALSALFCLATFSVAAEEPLKQEETSLAPTGASPAIPQAEPAPQPFPFSTESKERPLPHSYEGTLVKMIATLIGIGAFVVLTVWILRKIGQGRFRGFGSTRSIQVIERKPLSPKSMLYLVEVGHQKFLIAESQLEVRQLGTIEELSETVADETT